MQKIKLCGMMRECDIEYVNEVMPEYAGFVFADTRRKITREQAEKFRSRMDKRITAVGVFVDADAEEVGGLLADGIIDMAQLHGKEDEAYIRRLKRICDRPIIKAVKVREAEDIMRGLGLPADYLLLDTYRKGVPGGTGERFDWELLGEVREALKNKPFFLAGGLDADNIAEAMKQGAYGLDISSGIETDGYKDREKMIDIVRRIRDV